MPALPTWINLLILILCSTLWSQALEMKASESLQAGDVLKLSITDLTAPGLLVLNSDFHTEAVPLESGAKEFTLVLKHTGVLRITLTSGEEQTQLVRELQASLPAKFTRLEVNPRSEPVGTGQVQILSWSWDESFNPVPPPGALRIVFPKEQKEFQQASLGLLSARRIETTQNVGLAEVKLGDEMVVFRQVPGQARAFELTKQGDTVRSSNLADTYGNLLEDGTVATWTLYRGQQIHSTAQTSVLNGLVSIPLKRDSSRELKLKLEVLGQSAWIDLEPEE